MNHPDLDIVILAAGKGTRMHSAQPKVLHQIGGKSMALRITETAETLNPRSITIVAGHGKDALMHELRGKNVQWAEQAEQLGTGHALQTALPHLGADGRTLVLAGDVPLIDTATLAGLLETAGSGVGLLTDLPDNPAGYGRIIRDSNGSVTAIVEEKDATIEQKALRETNTGIIVLPNRRLADWLGSLKNSNAQGEYYLTDTVALAVRDGIPVHPLTVRAGHLAAGVNSKAQLAALERIFQREQAENLMQAGLTLADPARFDLRGSLKHGQDVFVDVGVVFEGENELGDKVSVGAHCVIRNAKIGSGTVIAPFSHLEGCTVGQDARIGPYARLRSGAELDGGVHIGNFVEVKNSRIGQGSKANHLSYIGDAEIGRHSNIGAGTITCNYDGVNKHRTHIGNDVRIGSNTSLVAPVRVEDRATTGAGSVITRNCPEGRLTVARARQTVIEGWIRPEKDSKPET